MAVKEIERLIAGTFLDMANVLERGESALSPVIALTALGSEHGEDELYRAACLAAGKGVRVKLLGSKPCDCPGVEVVPVSSDEEGHRALERMLEQGEAHGGVTMHYPFPIGVSTVGRVVTPATGREMFLATTTGTTALDRVEGMVRNAIYGIATAKACGIAEPTVGILNVDGARQTELALRKLSEGGYPIHFAQSGRSDGGAVMRGNDLLSASCDVMVTDPLTGNLLMKLFSAFTTGGSYESVGYGYGPGMGEGFDKLIMIVSRASGAPVIAGAMTFAAQLVRGTCREKLARELSDAKRAGLETILSQNRAGKTEEKSETVSMPPKEAVNDEIHGIEILDLEDAVQALWKEGIYAESGMGCTGPVIMIAETRVAESKEILAQKGYIG